VAKGPRWPSSGVTGYNAKATAADLCIRRAEMRLAEEFDAAQDRGEVAKGRPKSLEGGKSFQATAAAPGLRRDEINEARKMRDAARDDACKPSKTSRRA